MKKSFKDLTIDDIAFICHDNAKCESCPISSQCVTLFKDTPEKWAYFNKEYMNKEYINI